jgi:pyruvate/2-oxoglutarate dehydrogenase complex dihydrolipoamide acyltransferase (E2) component
VSSSATDQLVEVTMPKMGISVSEGTIVEWRKQPGDWVEADETIADVTTDKIDVEIPSPASGRIARLVVEQGDTVDVGATIAEIDSSAKPGEAHPEEDDAPEPDAPEPDEGPDRSSFYSPVVRRIADKHGVDLEAVDGTGIGGRVRKTDVLAHVEGDGTNGAAKAEPVLHTESPYKPEPSDEGRVASDGERRTPMSPMRKAIARHMVESRRTAAHCTTIVEVDMSRVAARRKELKASYLAFVARATVAALTEFPILNSSIEGDEIVEHDEVNLGIAVALDDGLIVPVIPRAQLLSVQGLTEVIADRAERARSKRLAPDDVHGGTFTITNPGQFGAVLATPIINQPQVAILDLEAIVKRPVVVEGPDGDSIAIRPMTYLCMSWDHRALDGAVAARFLGSIKDRLEAGGEL